MAYYVPSREIVVVVHHSAGGTYITYVCKM